MCMALQKQFAVVFITLLLQISIMNCCLINRRALRPFSMSQLDSLACAWIRGLEGQQMNQTNHAFVMSRSKCPAFLGSMSQHPAKEHNTRAHAGTTACGGRLFPDQSGRMPHRHRACLAILCASIDPALSGTALCEGPTATRRMFHGAFAGWATFMLVRGMCMCMPLLILNTARA
jgi:hypothetical protein